MPHHNSDQLMQHISNEELIRSVDGELPQSRATEVESHLQACRDCCARMEKIESAFTEFVRAHRGEFDGQLPSIASPRAHLRARLAELSSEPQGPRWMRFLPVHLSLPRVAVACLPLIATAVGLLWVGHEAHQGPRAASVAFAAAEPNADLTPGATRQITIHEVCSAPQEEVIADVSVPLRQRVLQEYGIATAHPEDYEIDYLITPGLGGTEDIRNLWPEPYRTSLWNAHVKDTLEERLHEMVCNGQLDLSTAQHDIATDWISAYKKYFHTNKPLPLTS